MSKKLFILVVTLISIMICCGIGGLICMVILPSGNTICKECDYIVRDLDDYEYCTNCSAKLTEDNLALRYEDRVCSKCGTKSDNTLDKCCGKCGTELGEKTIETGLSYNTYKFYSKIGSKFLASLLSIVLIVLGLLFIYLLYYIRFKDDDDDEEDDDDDVEY